MADSTLRVSAALQLSEREALARLAPLFEDDGVLRPDTI